MRIKEVAAATGISVKNIRFYEKEGMLYPSRSEQNQYREYSEDDVRILKEIKLLRKFDIPLKDIKSIQGKHLPLNEYLSRYILFLCDKRNELAQIIEMCKEINKNEGGLSTMDTDFYLNKINTMEKNGHSFTNIARDFITKAKGAMPTVTVSKFYFEPVNPITTKKEFTEELFKYAEREGKDLTVLREGMEPTVLLDGKKYTCMLEMPRTFSIFFCTWTYGFRWVYFYEYEAFEGSDKIECQG